MMGLDLFFFGQKAKGWIVITMNQRSATGTELERENVCVMSLVHPHSKKHSSMLKGSFPLHKRFMYLRRVRNQTLDSWPCVDFFHTLPSVLCSLFFLVFSRV